MTRDFPGVAERVPLPLLRRRRKVRRSWRSRFCQICRTRSSGIRRQFCTAKGPLSSARASPTATRRCSRSRRGCTFSGRAAVENPSFDQNSGKEANFLSWTRGVAESGVPNTHFTVQTRGRAFAAFERARLLFPVLGCVRCCECMLSFSEGF